jgi:hypothetical protein
MSMQLHTVARAESLPLLKRHLDLKMAHRFQLFTTPLARD